MKIISILLLSVLANACYGQMPTSMKWLNPPTTWSSKDQILFVHTNPKTDFWQITHYGYSPDNGHFYYQTQPGDFEATVQITGNYKELYDQAGLMIRIDSANWIKSGVEFVNGGLNISAVYTRTFSDWSVISLTKVPPTLWLKLKRIKDAVELSYSLDGKSFTMQRLGYFPPNVAAQIGIMAAAPEGKGFDVTFENFAIKNQ